MKRTNLFLKPFQWIGGYLALVGAGLAAVLYYIVALPVISMVQMFRLLFGSSFKDQVREPARLYHSRNFLRLLNRGGIVETGPGRLILDLIGAVDQVSVPAQDSMVKKGDQLITLQFADKDLHISSPLGGRIVQVNTAILQHPESMANLSPEYLWLVRIKPDNFASDLADLLPEHAFDQLVEAFNSQLMDFFGPDVAMADGGHVMPGLARTMPKDQWNQLKTKLSLE